MREETKGRYEMLWDCPACGTAKLLGITHRHCPNCGIAQDPTRRYFPPESERIAVENHPYHGADRICAGCDTPNAAKAEFCTGCGAPLDEAKAAATRAKLRTGAADSSTAAAKEAADRRKANEARRIAAASGKGGGGGGVAKAGIGIVGILVAVGVGGVGCLGIGGCLALCFAGSEASVQVTRHAWVRTIDIEELGTREDRAWRDEIPSGADVGDCDRQVRRNDKVENGEDCVDQQVDKGDGSFEEKRVCITRYRDEPVYDDKCAFEVDEWQEVSVAKSEGRALTPAPSWPTPKLTKPGDCLGCQRVGGRAEHYVVYLEGDGGEFECDLPEARWSKMAVGSAWKGSVNLMGSLDCDGLQPK